MKLAVALTLFLVLAWIVWRGGKCKHLPVFDDYRDCWYCDRCGDVLPDHQVNRVR